MDFRHEKNPGFFVIDRDRLEDVGTAFYGFTIMDGRIAKDPGRIDFAALSGHGCYVGIEKTEEEIIVCQDFMGSYGLYLYEGEGGYFALSNSFLLLVEYLAQEKRPYTVDQDYVNYMTAASLCSMAFGRTAVNEIRVLERNVRLHIDCKARNCREERLIYGENLTEPDSEEGIALLDGWAGRWISLFREIARETSGILLDLSGGFDSRVTFALFRNAGIDLEKICIHSIKDGKHTHSEDLEIAKKIADRFQFPLSNWANQPNERTAWSMQEMLGNSLYTKLYAHKQMYYLPGRFTQTRYHVTGNGGGCIRALWDMVPEEFVRKQTKAAEKYASPGDRSIPDATERILKDSIEKTRAKFEAAGYVLPEREIPKFVYRETRGRNHFGKSAVESFLSNVIVLSPLLDPDLHRLKSGAEKYGDPNFLLALIYVRYAPELLEFPFEGGREISPETVRAAEKASRAFPLRDFPPYNETVVPPAPPARKQGPELLSAEKANDVILRAFRSSAVQRAVENEFPEDLYRKIRRNCEEQSYFPLADLYMILGTVKLLQDQEPLPAGTVSMTEYLTTLARQEHLEEKWNSGRALPEALKARLDSFSIGEISNQEQGIWLRWEAVPGATGYDIYRKNAGKTILLASLGEGACSFLDGGPAEDSWGKVFVYSVYPKYRGYVSPAPAERTIQRLDGVAIFHMEEKEGCVTVSWQCEDNKNKASGYELEYAQSPGDLGQKGDTFRSIRIDGRKTMQADVPLTSESGRMYFRARAYSSYIDSLSGRTTISHSEYSPVAEKNFPERETVRDRLRTLASKVRKV